MKIGFVVAMEEEYGPFLPFLGQLDHVETVGGIEFLIYANDGSSIVLAKSGIGELASAASTALLIGKFGCDHIVNFGLVGSLDGTALRSLVCVRDVVHYDCDVTAFGYAPGQPVGFQGAYFRSDDNARASILSSLPAVRLASGDKFVSDTQLKNKLVTDFSANICDMEGAGIAITCARASIPFSMIKLVSDGADENAADTFHEAKSKAFGIAISYVLSLLRM